MLKADERDLLRKTILELISNGHDRQTDIEKRACATCLVFATPNTVRRQVYEYLLPCGFVVRVSRGTYRLTEKGRLQLLVLSS